MAAKLEKDAELARQGVIDPFEKHRTRPLTEHLGDFERHLRSRNNTAEHVQLVLSRVRKALDGCGFVFTSDVTASKIEAYLAALREGDDSGEGISVQTANHYLRGVKLRGVKQFYRWLVRDRRAADNPVAHLEILSVEAHRKRVRRTLTSDEFDKLVKAAEKGVAIGGMGGPDRAMLYVLAAYTGYRRDELASVTPSDIDFGSDPPTVTVQAGHSKHRRTDVVPLRRDVAERLQAWMAKRVLAADKSLFPVQNGRTAAMMQADLQTAGVPYVDARGRYADFHALRHTFISNLGKSGVHPKVAQSLARHSDINLTMNVYSHLELREQSEAIQSLPPLPTSAEEDSDENPPPAVPKVVPQTVPHGCRRKAGRWRRLARKVA